MEEENLDSVGKLQGRLDARSPSGGFRLRRRRLPHTKSDVKRSWGGGAQGETAAHGALFDTRPKKRTSSVTRSLFIGSLVFFLIAAGVSAFFFFGGTHTVSSRNIDLTVSGPLTVDGGKEFPLQVTVTNRNATPLEFTDLLIEFPEGTRSADGSLEPLARFRESLATIAPNESVQKALRLVMFGGSHVEKEIKVTLEYRLAGSNAIFFKEESYSLVIASAPVEVTVTGKSEVTTGQEVELAIEVFSNTQTLSRDVLLVAEYPSGFSYAGAVPEPSSGTNAWKIGDMPPGGRVEVRVRGTLAGQDGDERVFRFSIGVRDPRSENRIETAFASALQPIVIKRPFLGVGIALNGDTESDLVISSRNFVRGDVTWANNLATPITDAEFFLTIGGAALDKTTVTVGEGFYRSVDNTILWSRQSAPALASVSPGGEGSVSFSFAPFRPESGIIQTLRNPEITLDLSVRGKRLSERGVPEEITSTLSRRVRIATDLALTPELHYTNGPLSNRGPLPPRVDQETTYTVTWSITNTTNGVTGARVSGALPPYVKWLGTKSPADANVVFSTLGGDVTWSAGDVPPGVGTATSPKTVSFQVGLTPSVSQIGGSPVIIGEMRFSARDQFTDTAVEYKAPNLTIEDVSGASAGNYGRVVE